MNCFLKNFGFAYVNINIQMQIRAQMYKNIFPIEDMYSKMR